MAIAQLIEDKLRARLAPLRLAVFDDSDQHKGHGGWRPGGETHFRLEIVSAAFEGQGRVARQRLIYEILAEELAAQIHALQLQTLTPEEDRAAGN